jgi:colanic acid/amylovoran biosynthesis glycosyltransferase
LPSVSDPETYIAAADATVIASPVEGLPVVALESLAAGKPVILSRGANASALIEDGVTGWVAPTNSPEDLAAALREMLLTPSERLASASARCRETALRYDLTALAQRYMTLYEALVKLPRAATAYARRAALAAVTR